MTGISLREKIGIRTQDFDVSTMRTGSEIVVCLKRHLTHICVPVIDRLLIAL